MANVAKDILENILCVQKRWETKQAWQPLGKLNLLTTASFPPWGTATSGNSMNSCLNNKTLNIDKSQLYFISTSSDRIVVLFGGMSDVHCSPAPVFSASNPRGRHIVPLYPTPAHQLTVRCQ